MDTMIRGLAAALAIASVLVCRLEGAAQSRPSAKPNIVMILTDDQVFRALGCAGNKAIHTPNLDRLAAQGTRFTTAVVASPVCVASRASIWSSLYPQQHGSIFLDNQPFIRKAKAGQLKPFPQYLAEAGYVSGYCGKSHLGDPRENLGFQEGGEMVGGSDEKAFAFAEEFLTAKAGGPKPFFLCIAPTQPHIPLQPPDRWREFYKPQDMPLDPNYREATAQQFAHQPGCAGPDLLPRRRRPQDAGAGPASSPPCTTGRFQTWMSRWEAS